MMRSSFGFVGIGLLVAGTTLVAGGCGRADGPAGKAPEDGRPIDPFGDRIGLLLPAPRRPHNHPRPPPVVEEEALGCGDSNLVCCNHP